MSTNPHPEPPSPNQLQKRSPWYALTAPCLASVFLWVGFYQPLADGTVDRAGFGALFVALLVAGALSYALLYHVPATLGLETRHSLTGIASASFGSGGTWIVPGLLVGILVTLWFGASLRTGARLILEGSGLDSGPGQFLAIVPAGAVGLIACLAAAGGSVWVVRLAFPLVLISAGTMALLLLRAADGILIHTVSQPDPIPARLLLIQMVTAFAATICVAAPDFGRKVRTSRDVLLGGVAGLSVPIVYAGFLGLLTATAGHHLNQSAGLGYMEAAAGLGAEAPYLLALTSLPAASVFCLLAGSNLGAALPSLSARLRIVIVGVGGVLFAVTGLSDDVAGLATITGALLVPVAGVITADYVRAGRRWPHARPGINYAGFGAVALGGLIGLLPYEFPGAQPAVVYSFLAGFVGYLFLCQLGLKPERKRIRRRRRR